MEVLVSYCCSSFWRKRNGNKAILATIRVFVWAKELRNVLFSQKEFNNRIPTLLFFEKMENIAILASNWIIAFGSNKSQEYLLLQYEFEKRNLTVRFLFFPKNVNTVILTKTSNKCAFWQTTTVGIPTFTIRFQQ